MRRARLTQALHPHVGTLVETAADVATVLEASDVALVPRHGHLLIGGYDPAKFAVDAGGSCRPRPPQGRQRQVAERVAGGELSIQAGVGDGLFCPLGAG